MAIQPEAPRILIADSLPPQALEPLTDRGYQVDYQPAIPQTKLAYNLGGYDGLIIRSGKTIRAEDLQNFGKLKVIARAGVGVDNIDVDACTDRAIMVINTPEGNTTAAAELTMGHILALARHIPEAYVSIREGGWNREKLVGTELRGKTLGIVGLGKIGSAVAKRAIAFEMSIIGYDPMVTEKRAGEIGVQLTTLEDLLRTADFITLHVPLIDKTRNLMNRDTLAHVKPNAYLINVARGKLIDEEALIEALDEGRLAGAALDVFPNEPQVSEAIRRHPKVIFTPHLGASTGEALERVGLEASRGVIEVLEGRLPNGAVNLPDRLSPESYRQLVPFLPVAEGIATLAAWLAEGQRITEVETYYLGKISEFGDLRPLRAAFVRGLVSRVSEQTVSLVNYRRVEEQFGLRFKEVTSDANKGYSSSISIRLRHGDGETLVHGVHAQGEDKTKVINVNGFPVECSMGKKPLLICTNIDQPGMVADVANYLGKMREVNIDAMSVGSHPANGQAMMIFTLKRSLKEAEAEAIKGIPGILSAIQFNP